MTRYLFTILILLLTSPMVKAEPLFDGLNSEYVIHKGFATDLAIVGELPYKDFPPLTLSYGINGSKTELVSILEKAIKHIPIDKIKTIKEQWLSKNSTVLYPSKSNNNKFQNNSGLSVQPSTSAFISSMGIALTQEEEAYIKSKAIIKVSNESDYPPFDFVQNGQSKGYNIDLLNLLAKKINIEVDYVRGRTWNDMLEMFKAGELDLLHALTITPSRLKYGLFSEPYRYFKTYYVTLQGSQDISNIQQLYGKTFAVGKGWAQEEFLRQQHPKIKLLVVNSAKEMLQAVSNGEADVTAGNGDILNYLIKKKGIRDLNIGNWFREFDQNKGYSHHFMAQKTEPELVSLLNKALDSLTIAELDNLESKWFGLTSRTKPQIPLTEQEQAFIQKHPKIVLGGDATWEPHTMVDSDGSATGFDADVIKKINQLTGLNIQLSLGKWANKVQAAKERTIDGLTSSAVNPERAEHFNFSEPYTTFKRLIYIKGSNPKNIQKPGDLISKRLAITDGNLSAKKLALSLGVEKIIEYGSPVEIFQALIAEEVDAYIDAMPMMYIARKEGYFHNIDSASVVGEPLNLVFSVRNDWPELQSIINKALKHISEEEKAAIRERWYGTYVKAAMPHKLLDLTEQEKQFLKNHPVIRVSNEMDYPPFDFVVGNEPHGYSIDLLNLIAERAGLQLQYVNGYTWDELWKMFERRELDITQPVYKNSYREQFGFFSKQIFSGNSIFITQSNAPAIKSIDDLKDKIIAMPKGWATTTFLQTEHPDIQLLLLDNTEQCIQAVSDEKAYATIEMDAVAHYILQKELRSDLKANGRFDEFDNKNANDFYFLVRKDWPLLHQILTKAQNSITAQELEALQNKWFGSWMTGEIPIVFLTPQEKQYLAQKKVLKQCARFNQVPFEWINEKGRYQGIAKAFSDLISKRIGIAIELNPSKTWQESLNAGQYHQCDMVILENPLQYDRLDFSDSFFSTALVLATKTDTPFFNDVYELQGKKIGVVKGSSFNDDLARKYPAFSFIPISSINHGLDQVRQGQLYGFVDTLTSLGYLIQKESMLDIKIAGKLDLSVDTRVGVRNDEPLLLNIIQKAVNSITEEEKRNIVNSWISVKYEKGIDYQLLWQILVVALLIITIIIYWNRRLFNFNQRITQANQALAEAQRIAGLGSWEYDVLLDKITWSEEVFRIAGMEGRTEPPAYEEYLQTIHSDDRPKLIDSVQDALAGKAYELELRHLRPDGDYNYTLTRARPVIKEGKTVKVQGTVLDLTHLRKMELTLKDEMAQRRLYEQSLKTSEERFRSIVEASSDWIWEVDANGIYTYASAHTYNLLGYKPDELIGKTPFDLMPDEEARRIKAIFFEQVSQKLAIKNLINVNTHKNGHKVILETSGTPIINEQGELLGYRGVDRDITEQVNAQLKLEKAKAEAESANQAKSEFLANMSHEIRTPLNSVLGFSELLEQTEVTAKQESYLKSIRSGGKTLLSIINDILDLSKIEAGKMVLEAEPVNLRQIMLDVQEIFVFKINEKKLEFTLDISESIPEFLILDETRIRQVLFNIVGNAIKFTHKGGITIKVYCIPCNTRSNNLELTIEVIDTGIGIPQEQHHKIFGSFEQQQGQNTRLYGGTGLGLAISNKLVKLMGGEILLESQPDVGSSFTIHLPKVVPELTQRNLPGIPGIEQEEIFFEPATVLVVDDVESNRELVRNILQQHELKCIEAMDGSQALMLIEQSLPDLIFMDIRMPIMNGIAATQKLKNNLNYSHIPIIALTASMDYRGKGQEQNIFDGYLRKPVSYNELISELKKFLSHKTRQKQSKSPANMDTSIKFSPEVLEELKKALPLKELALKSGLFTDVQKFSDKILEIGKQYEIDLLIDYAAKLQEALDNFDIDEMNSQLEYFSILFQP